jgi:hypothetical protein
MSGERQTVVGVVAEGSTDLALLRRIVEHIAATDAEIQ